ncbi:MAG TPA: hypothetical protein DCR55_14340 [Lentisphaeria bacterium]|nr:hypothetical protein [Lentisphaeria bacterium]
MTLLIGPRIHFPGALPDLIVALERHDDLPAQRTSHCGDRNRMQRTLDCSKACRLVRAAGVSGGKPLRGACAIDAVCEVRNAAQVRLRNALLFLWGSTLLTWTVAVLWVAESSRALARVFAGEPMPALTEMVVSLR